MNRVKIYLLLTQNNIEIWRDIENWEGYYKISNLGRVMTKNNTLRNTKTYNNSGYLTITLKCKESGNKPQTKTIHRLVANTFLPNPYNLTDVGHMDEDKTNNKLTNLMWQSHKDNCNYGNRNKKLRDINLGRTGELSPKSKKVYCMELDKYFVSVTFAEKYMKEVLCKGCNIAKCCRGDSKTAGGYHWKYVED